MKKIEEILQKMTLEEKASLCSGLDMWRTKEIKRLGVPSILMTDGPHGLRKQGEKGDNLGIYNSVPATAFPTASLTACSFDRALLGEMGEALAEECLAQEVSILLGPGANIKRSPLCGRNFEYFSEDPYLASEMAKSYINGIQGKGVGASLKHFAANNQENRRMTANSIVDERTLHEIYLAAFETAVKEAQPWTVMCAYNLLNGTYASENTYLLTDVLREEWGFEGFVVSDWGAVNDRVAGVLAGLDLEMPNSGGANDQAIVDAVRNGKITEAQLDKAVERILAIICKAEENKKSGYTCDLEAHHKLAAKIAAESMVLLKNENILPLQKEQKVVFVGEFFENPRYQGGGSSHVNCFQMTTAQNALADKENMTYRKGFHMNTDDIDLDLQSEAVEAARTADVCVIFAGLPEHYESEGYDRKHLRLPQNQNTLIEKILTVQPNTVVVLQMGAPVEMPWEKNAAGILAAYLGGQASGQAVADTLYGNVNPSGRLAETFPVKLADTPAHLGYGLHKDTCVYSEGIFVGYRYYDKKEMPVLYPFGHGLSYTSFAYAGLCVDKEELRDTESVTVTVRVKNTGNVAGKEVVQLYVAQPVNDTINPVRQLRGFEKLLLQPGEEKTVSFTLSFRDFAYYNDEMDDWHVDGGRYVISVGKSSRDLVFCQPVTINPTKVAPQRLSCDMTVKELRELPQGGAFLAAVMEKMPHLSGMLQMLEGAQGEASGLLDMINAAPLRSVTMFGGGHFSLADLKEMVERHNLAHSNISAVIFDLDGVIVSTDRFHYQAWKEMADREGIPFNEEDNHRLRGVSRLDSLNIVLEKAAKTYSDEEKLALATEKNERYKVLLETLTPNDLLPGVLAMLEALRKKGYKLAIGSASQNTAFILRRIGLANYFDAVADGTHISRSKPDPEVFLKAAEFLQVPPEKCAVIEDADSGIEAALAAGMLAVGVGEAAKNDKAAIRAANLKRYRRVMAALARD